MLIKYRKFGAFAVFMLILLVCSGGGLADDSEENADTGETVEKDLPGLPLIVKGELDVNGEPVAVGSEIQAYYEGELIAKSVVKTEGEYALNLNLEPADYVNIGDVEFYIDGDQAEMDIPASGIEAITEEDAPGSIIAVDIQGAVSQSSGGSGGDGDGEGEDEVKVVKKEGEVSESSAGELGEESEDSEYASGEQEPEFEDSRGSADSSDKQPVFWIVLLIAAFLGVILIVRKKLVG